MAEKHNEATTQRPEGERPIDSQQISIDLPAYIRQIKEESNWKQGKRNSITVFKTKGMTIVLIALRAGAEMAEHSADGLISVQVLEGQMQFDTGGKSHILSRNQMIALHEKIPHRVLAIEETIFLLTLASTPK